MNRSVNETVICPQLRKRKVLFLYFYFRRHIKTHVELILLLTSYLIYNYTPQM